MIERVLLILRNHFVVVGWPDLGKDWYQNRIKNGKFHILHL